MTASHEMLEQGLQCHQAGKFQQAEQIYRQVLTAEPGNADAWHLLGLLAHQVGAREVAIAHLQQAIQLQPHQAAYYNSLGETYRALGNYAAAIAHYTQALDLNPDYSEAHYNLANALQAKGDLNAAIASYRRAIELKPTLAQAHHNLGFLLKQQGQLEAAIAAYRQAIALQPNYSLALSNLGVALTEAEQFAEAIAVLQQAIQLQPDFAAAYLNLGNTQKLLGNVAAASQSYAQAVQLHPNWPEAYFVIGNFYKDQGQTQVAITYYQKALNLKPTYAEAQWNQQLILPILYETPEQILEWRQQLTANLNALCQQVTLETAVARQQALAGVSSATNFFLQYQGLNDRDLQQQYGQLVSRVMAANYPQWTRKLQRKAISRKVRVGFVSHFFREHTVAKLFLGWVQQLDKTNFDSYIYYLGRHPDAFTQAFRQASHTLHHYYDQFERVCQQIERDRLDILIFTDIGMTADSYKLAALRLAPVQCVTWGHPVTSGIPTIDYYLSSQLMEPEHAQQHYSETLICLPKTSIAYPKPKLPQRITSRAVFQLGDDRIIYLSCQSLYKYLPQYDYLFPQIAQQVPQAQFVFLSSPTKGDYVTLQFQARLQQAFAKQGLNSQNYCRFMPRLNWQDYLSLNLVSDVFLDTLDWSGGNTTLEAIACDLPIVTCPGEFMRGRHAYGMLQTLGVTATIAQTEVEYLEIAVRLGLDPQWRQAIIAQMQSRHSQLYNDLTCVRALEQFFLDHSR